jgi:hypothetical protein
VANSADGGNEDIDALEERESTEPITDEELREFEEHQILEDHPESEPPILRTPIPPPD